MKRLIRDGLAMILGALIALPSFVYAADLSKEAKELVQASAVTFDNFMSDTNFTWFRENLKNANALLIFPNVLKAGFFWGGSGGNGVLVVRDDRTGAWSQPAFYSMGSVSFGLQAGAEDAEVIMFAMNRRAVDTLYVSSFKFGGAVSVAAGPHGLGAKKIITADFISFAKSRGLYAGLDLEGSGIQVRDDLNRAFYGKEVRPVQIIVEKRVSSANSGNLLETLRKAVK